MEFSCCNERVVKATGWAGVMDSRGLTRRIHYHEVMRTKDLRTKVTVFISTNRAKPYICDSTSLLRIALLSDPYPYPSNNKNGNNIIHKTTKEVKGRKRKPRIQKG